MLKFDGQLLLDVCLTQKLNISTHLTSIGKEKKIKLLYTIKCRCLHVQLDPKL